jgi:C4-type Zn-finger protein
MNIYTEIRCSCGRLLYILESADDIPNMATVVQVKCSRCKKIIRINELGKQVDANWVSDAFIKTSDL